MMKWWNRFLRILKHRWLEGHARRLMTPQAQQRIADKVAASEALHTGQIRIYVEGGMPAHYIWHDATPRERALVLFGKTGVWDTEHNNGVLIYLLVAEHAIEIVTDRGLHGVSEHHWQNTIAHLTHALRTGLHEKGLMAAIDEVTVELVKHFPAPAPHNGCHRDNELPDTPIVR